MSTHIVLRHRGRVLEAHLAQHGGRARLDVEGRAVEATVRREGRALEVVRGDGTVRVHVAPAPHGVWVAHAGRAYHFETPRAEEGEGPVEFAPNEVRAPMTARVVSVAAIPGTRVKEGELLVTLEAMKMEFRLAAPMEGPVGEVLCAPGDRVDVGQLLVRLGSAEDAHPAPPPDGAGELEGGV